MKPLAIERWHQIAETRNPRGLDALLSQDVVFQSPVVHTPQVGKAITTAYLAAAVDVLGGEKFRYVGEWYAPTSAVLEFTTEIDGIQINGIDMIGWNDAGQITSFKVMVRPLKAVNILHQKMGEMLERMKKRA